MNSIKLPRGGIAAAVLFAALLIPAVASAHGVARGDARFLQSLHGAAVAPLMCLGAKHMVIDPVKHKTRIEHIPHELLDPHE